jgi:tRNA (cytidine32/uridine32-2'-O)-methyltransferase
MLLVVLQGAYTQNLRRTSRNPSKTKGMPTPRSLKNISIILVDTRTPANIGSTARCMMNMGMNRLVLVNPPQDKNDEASKLAAGADKILKNAVVTASLIDAVAGQHLVIGTSRHPGRLRKNIRTPREAAEAIAPLLEKNSVSVVFGNEVNGLDMRNLSLCHEIIAIPSSPSFPSLNLSHAVMVVAYEFFCASTAGIRPSTAELASAKELEDFYHHLQETLLAIGFLEQDHPERMMFSLRQMFGRSRLEGRDVKILRGILSSIGKMRSNC